MRTKKEYVEELLKKKREGLTVTEISNVLNFSRNTIAVILAELKGAGKIRIRKIGMAKLHYLKGENKS